MTNAGREFMEEDSKYGGKEDKEEVGYKKNKKIKKLLTSLEEQFLIETMMRKCMRVYYPKSTVVT